MLYTPEFVRAWNRHLEERRKQKYESTRLWNADSNRVGMLGELAVAMFLRGWPDLRNRPGGDKGIDIEALLDVPVDQLIATLWIEIDAKGSPNPSHLSVQPKSLALQRIYVLTGPDDRRYIDRGILPYIEGIGWLYRCYGWAWGHEIAKIPLSTFRDDADPAHHKPQGQLHLMRELKAMYREQWRHHGCDAQPAEPELSDFEKQYKPGAHLW